MPMRKNMRHRIEFRKAFDKYALDNAIAMTDDNEEDWKPWFECFMAGADAQKEMKSTLRLPDYRDFKKEKGKKQ